MSPNRYDTIQQLYDAFKEYSLTGRLDRCPCGCISDQEEARLYASTLKTLTAEDLGFYAHKAMTTWGSVDDFKHFLPRLLELFHRVRYNGWIDLHTITTKLKYGNWHQWPQVEQEAIRQFVFADWKYLANETEAEVGLDDLNEYGHYASLGELINSWEYAHSKAALKNFVRFVYQYGNHILSSRKAILIGGQDQTEVFRRLLRQSSLAQMLEGAFFELQDSDPAFAEQVSIVHQMIENEIKLTQ